ncbi:hypothetical protein QEN19_001667 [Hanseniaspora menglaensis]
MFAFKNLAVHKQRSFFASKRLYTSIRPPIAEKNSAGIKQLIAKYGYTSLATYLAIGAVDFALCYMVIHKIGEEELYVKYNKLKETIGFKAKTSEEVKKEFELKRESQKLEHKHEHTQNEFSLWGKIKQYGILLFDNTMFKEVIIAYGIHKSLIFVRLPITAMITPPIYKYLLKVKPSWVLKPQNFSKQVVNPMIKGAGNEKKSQKVSWWKKMIG